MCLKSEMIERKGLTSLTFGVYVGDFVTMCSWVQVGQTLLNFSLIFAPNILVDVLA